MLGTRKSWMTAVAVLTVVALTPGAAFAAPQVAAIHIDSAEVAWQPQVANGGMVLTVSIPGGEVLRQEFAAGAAPSFGLFDENGAARPDGQYTWELLAVPASVPSEVIEARGDAGAMAKLQASGKLPGPMIDSGYFRVVGGAFFVPDGASERPAAPAGDAPARVAAKDQVIADDLIVDGSICAGLDCVNGESFGFDTLRLKENNLRIKAQDTSNSASFPTNDWQITFNDSSNGGANKFSIDDIDGGRTPFTIEAGTPSHTLYVDSSKRIGIGTATPVVTLHIKDGNTPTLRLEQDGSSGFTPQTWDVAGNETNFFIRDATNGSTLPFRIRPSAPSNSIFVDTDGDVGMGTSSPGSLTIGTDAALHIRRTDGSASQLIEEASGTTAPRGMLELKNNGNPRMFYEDTAINQTWVVNPNASGDFIIDNDDQSGQVTARFIATSGDLQVRGNFISGTTTLVVPDYVFEPGYELLPLDQLRAFIEENRHLPKVPSAEAIQRQGGLNMTEFQMRLLEKVEELTLYVLQQEETIDSLRSRLDELTPVPAQD